MKKLLNIVYRGINKIIDFLNIDLKKKIPNIEITEEYKKIQESCAALVKASCDCSVTVDQAARNIRKAFGVPTLEDEFINERSDYFDKEKYIIGIDWGFDHGNN